MCVGHRRSHVSFYWSRSWLDIRRLFCISQFCWCTVSSSGLGQFAKSRDSGMFLDCDINWIRHRSLSLLQHPGRGLKLSWSSMGSHAVLAGCLGLAVCWLADGCYFSRLQKELDSQRSVQHDVQPHLCLPRMQDFEGWRDLRTYLAELKVGVIPLRKPRPALKPKGIRSLFQLPARKRK